MKMERITSRKNSYISHIRRLEKENSYRRENGEFICDGEKMLEEAVAAGKRIMSVLWKESGTAPEPMLTDNADCAEYICPAELFDYASPMISSPGPLFTVAIDDNKKDFSFNNAIILENVQDPGNVGTIIRTANAFGIDAVILTGACADIYNPKTVRSTMGAVFRQHIISMSLNDISRTLKNRNMKLYGAVLSPRAKKLDEVHIKNSAVAVGSEGQGLSHEIIELCDGEIIIPMQPGSESLNAAVAASVIMWEMR